MANNNTIGNRIKLLREAINETQADLSKVLNVKRETVNQWENNTRDIKTQYTVSLAEHFETTCDYILRGIQADNISVHDKTGLSDNAINMLSNRNKIKYDDYVKTVDMLITSNLFIIDDISKFLFRDYVINHNEHHTLKNNELFLYEKNGSPQLFDTSEINAIFLLKAQAKLLSIKENLLKEGEI